MSATSSQNRKAVLTECIKIYSEVRVWRRIAQKPYQRNTPGMIIPADLLSVCLICFERRLTVSFNQDSINKRDISPKLNFYQILLMHCLLVVGFIVLSPKQQWSDYYCFAGCLIIIVLTLKLWSVLYYPEILW